VKGAMDLPKIAGIGSEYFLLGFFLFIAFYIIVRLLAERHEHRGKKGDGLKDLRQKEMDNEHEKD
jgi:hypothetical protein